MYTQTPTQPFTLSEDSDAPQHVLSMLQVIFSPLPQKPLSRPQLSPLPGSLTRMGLLDHHYHAGGLISVFIDAER